MRSLRYRLFVSLVLAGGVLIAPRLKAQFAVLGRTIPRSGSAPVTPTLTSVVPSTGAQGETVPVTLIGTGFVIGATTVDVSGSGVTVNTIVVSTTTTLTAHFVLDAMATIGARDVTVTTAGGTSGSQTFTITVPTGFPTAANFTYDGSFRVPTGTTGCPNGSDGFSFGGQAVFYYPAGNGGSGSMYMSNDIDVGCAAEITVPALVAGDDPSGGNSTNLTSLNRATFIQNFADITEGLVYSDTYFHAPGENFGWMQGLLVDGGYLYGTMYHFYDNSPYQKIALFRHSLTLSSSTGFFGWESLDTPSITNRHFAGHFAVIPSSLQAGLGGTVMTGRFGGSIVGGSSLGPDAVAFNIASIGSDTPSTDAGSPSSSPVAASILLDYPQDHSTLGAWGCGTAPNYYYTEQSISGGQFIEGGFVIFIGHDGVGHAINPNTGLDESTCYYGDGTTDWALNGVCEPEGCDVARYSYDPAGGTKGQRGWPYYTRAWVYTVADFLAVKAGADPWSITPVTVFPLILPWPDIGNKNGGNPISISYEPSTKHLYIVQRFIEPGSFPVVHRYTYTPPS